MATVTDLLRRSRARGFTVAIAGDGESLDVRGPRDRDGNIVQEIQEQRDDVIAYLRGDDDGPPPAGEKPKLRARTVRELISNYPALRPPVIHGLLRTGETMNIIAAPKVGKSWLTTDLALCVATGRQWLGTYETVQGSVLIVDNELHGETTAARIPKVADARGIPLSDYGDAIQVANVRGQLADLLSLQELFGQYRPGDLRVVIIDAFYRALPAGADENSNAEVASLYNLVDRYALQLDCSFVLIHHSTKGNQSAKAVTDVGSGAGSQSRATDTHLILRPHEEPGVVVLDAAVRSWAPIDPTCLRWQWPLWDRADDMDPTLLARETSRRRPAKSRVDLTVPAPEWTPERFAAEIVGAEPATMAVIVTRARTAGLPERRAKEWLATAEGRGLCYRLRGGPRDPHRYSTVPLPEEMSG